jgi:hypothetical protein
VSTRGTNAAAVDAAAPVDHSATVRRLAQAPEAEVTGLLTRYGLELRLLPAGTEIPGSYWGESEAGLVRNVLFVRPDTPLHSLLHEASHFICMTGERRASLDRDAGGDDPEEAAVCYLQILLADALTGFGRECALRDMDAWGYSFRHGSARAWFEDDATDARDWLLYHAIIDPDQRPTGRCRA